MSAAGAERSAPLLRRTRAERVPNARNRLVDADGSKTDGYRQDQKKYGDNARKHYLQVGGQILRPLNELIDDG